MTYGFLLVIDHSFSYSNPGPNPWSRELLKCFSLSPGKPIVSVPEKATLSLKGIFSRKDL
jgi:hypothetical protein